MKITLISLSTPTFNNVRAASALPYHLIKGMQLQGNVSFDIYSFNVNSLDTQEINKTEKELSVNIHLLPIPQWIKWMFKLHLLFLRILLRYPLFAYLKLSKEVVNQINKTDPDIVWLYGEELAGISKKFPAHKCLVTMPDCESMYYYRMLAKRFATRNFIQILRYAYAYWQYRGMERNFFNKNIIYHFVGQADADFYKEINPEADSRFVRHPLYAHQEKLSYKFHAPKIKILIAGRNDVYMQEDCDALIKELCLAKNALKKHFRFTFLGKGWEADFEILKAVGYDVQLIHFAKDYIEELQKHDIQITPISVGTGTKGKVLDALANGLLVIGTKRALENIAVKDKQSCLQYKDAQEVIEFLSDIQQNTQHYERMAKAGCEVVLKYHNREMISKKLFSFFIT